MIYACSTVAKTTDGQTREEQSARQSYQLSDWLLHIESKIQILYAKEFPIIADVLRVQLLFNIFRNCLYSRAAQYRSDIARLFSLLQK